MMFKIVDLLFVIKRKMQKVTGICHAFDLPLSCQRVELRAAKE